MRSARIAEWILALFLEPDRAAAYTGDLTEEANEHGPVWFWFSVARIAIMRFWYDIAESPFFLAGVLMRAWLLNIALSGLFIAGFIVLLVPAAMLVGFLHVLGFHALGIKEQIWRLLGSLTGIALVFFAAFYTGRWIARKMPRREIAACIAMCVVQPLLYSVVGLVVMQIWGARLEHYLLTHPVHNNYSADFPVNLIGLLGFIGFLAGGVRVRRRSAAR